jgi:hypothetical protein
MNSPRIRCQVLEVPARGHLESSADQAAPRDLLPWADPYIAALLAKVEREYWQDEQDRREFGHSQFEDEELDSALEAEAAEMYGKFFPAFDDNVADGKPLPRVYGGWRLLDDMPRDDEPFTS